MLGQLLHQKLLLLLLLLVLLVGMPAALWRQMTVL
jgi:hypothetical protein